MVENRSDDSASGSVLFPQFESKLYDMISLEVEGLSDQQLDWQSESWEWSKWSIRRQVSHMAFFTSFWLLRRWGEQLFPTIPSDLGERGQYAMSEDGSWLDEKAYSDMPLLLGKVKDAMGLAQYVMTHETVGSMGRKELKIDNIAQWQWYRKAHPGGFQKESADSATVYMSLEATFRHMYYEVITHLYNVQRIKRAQGLTASQQIPFEGYWALPDWDRSEP